MFCIMPSLIIKKLFYFSFNKTPDNIHSASKNEIPSEQEHAIGTTGHGLEECDTCVETDSVYSGG